MKLTPKQYRALNSKKRIVAKQLKKNARLEEIRKRTPDSVKKKVDKLFDDPRYKEYYE